MVSVDVRQEKMKHLLTVICVLILGGCSAPRPKVVTLPPWEYRVDLGSYYSEQTWPAKHHPMFDIAICGLTDFAYQTPDGIIWRAHAEIPADVFTVTATPTNQALLPLAVHIFHDGTNVHVAVEHGTNTWTYDNMDEESRTNP
jgi:hypothetical protein